MTGPLVGAGFGRVVALDGPDDALDAARRYLPYWWADADAEPDVTITVPVPQAAATIVRELEHWVAEHAVDRVFVHAATVAVDGHAIVLPGRSWTGKTTLCAALLRAGAHYLSDEYAVLDAEGRVHPYPRPLHVRDGAGRRSALPAGQLGGTVAERPVRLAVLGLLRFDEDAGWRVEEISPAHAVLGVLDQCVAARSRSEECLDAVHAATASAVCLQGTRGDAPDAAAALLQRLRAHTAP